VEKGKGAAQFDQRGANSNNDDGGASNFSGIQRDSAAAAAGASAHRQRQQRELQRIGSGSSGIQREWRARTSELIQRGLVAYGVISN
jgi:hypothetical protein